VLSATEKTIKKHREMDGWVDGWIDGWVDG
jgi:hypothetical protein